MKAKSYCIAFGCSNNNKDPKLTFFTVPKDIERRRKWMTLINREDLLQREDLKKSSHLVCSAHFEESSIKIIKHLKENALPSMLLHNQTQEGSCSEAQSTPVQVIGEVTNRIIKKRSCCSEYNGKGRVIILSNNKEYVAVGTQTESLRSSEEQIQTSKSITEGTPRKRKLSIEIQEYKLDKKIKKEIKEEKMEETDVYNLQ